MKKLRFLLAIFLVIGTVFASTGCPQNTGGQTSEAIPSPVIVVRTDTYLVASSDAPAQIKAQADYVCDGTADQIEINAALAIRSVKLSIGTFKIANNDSIAVPSNRSLIGDGYNNTLITITSGSSGVPVIINSDTSGGNTNIIIRDLKVDGNESGVRDYTPGITLQKVTGGEISGCWVQNCNAGGGTKRGWGIGVVQSSQIEIFNNVTTDNQHAGIRVTKACSKINIHHNKSYLNDAEGIAVSTESNSGSFTGEANTNIIIDSNILWGNSTLSTETVEAISVEDKATSGAGNQHRYITVINNQINGNYGGITFYRAPSVGTLESDSLVANNIITGCTGKTSSIQISCNSYLKVSGNKVIGSVASNGIALLKSDYSSVANNDISGCAGLGIAVTDSPYSKINLNNINTCTSVPIDVISGSNDCNISDNTIVAAASIRGLALLDSSPRCTISDNNITVSGQNNGDGIDIRGTSGYCLIEGNEIINAEAATTPNSSGIHINSDYNKIIGNKIYGINPGHQFYYAIDNDASADNNTYTDNDLIGGFRVAAFHLAGTNFILKDNQGDVAPR
jgi:parallel beta-helix repeat protein